MILKRTISLLLALFSSLFGLQAAPDSLDRRAFGGGVAPIQEWVNSYDVGEAGSFALPSSDGTRLWMSTSRYVDRSFDFEYVLLASWKVMRWNGNQLETAHIAPIYTAMAPGLPLPAILSISPLQTAAGIQVVVALDDGRLFRYDPETYAKISEGKFALPGQKFRHFAANDLDGDQNAECLWLTVAGLYASDLAGDIQWFIAGVTGESVVVGQLDGDSQLEIVVSGIKKSYVIDSRTRELQWEVDNSFGRQPILANLDKDPALEIISSRLQCFDMASRSMLFKVAEASGEYTIALANGDGGRQSLIALSLDDKPDLIYDISRAKTTEENYAYGSSILITDADSDGDLDLVLGKYSGVQAFELATKKDIPVRSRVAWSAGFGDLNGDKKEDLVLASGSLLRLNPDNFRVLDSYPLPWASPFQLCDLFGGPTSEVLISNSDFGYGFPEVVQVKPNSATILWERNRGIRGGSTLALDAVDLDGDGTKEIISLQQEAINILSLETKQVQWSVRFPEYDYAANSLIIGDYDDDPQLEILCAVEDKGIYVLDSKFHTLETVVPGDFTAITGFTNGKSIFAGDAQGVVREFRFVAGEYLEKRAFTVRNEAGKASDSDVVTALAATEDALFVGANGRVSRWNLNSNEPDWYTSQADYYGPSELRLWQKDQTFRVFATFEDGLRVYENASVSSESLTLEASVNQIAEGAAIDLVASRSGNVHAALTASLIISGTADSGRDFIINEHVEFPPGVRQVPVPIRALKDRLAEPTETLLLEFASTQGFKQNPQAFPLAILDQSPMLSLSMEDISLNEGETSTLRISSSIPVDYPLKVLLQTTGPEKVNTDLLVPGEVTLRGGATEVTVQVTSLADSVDELPETFKIGFLPSHEYHSSPEVLKVRLAEDQSELQVVALRDTVSERALLDERFANFMILRSENLDREEFVKLRFRGTARRGSDYRWPPEYIRMQPGEKEVLVKIRVYRDSRKESPKSLSLQLVPRAGYTVVSPSSATVTITD